jgi:hypothetical protein
MYRRWLGLPARQLMLQSSETPATYRWIWPCGCRFDFIDDQRAIVHELLPCAGHVGIARHVYRQERCARVLSQLREFHRPPAGSPLDLAR